MSKLEKTHIFPVATETAGSWSQQAIELVQIGRRISAITEDNRKTTCLALQRGNAISFIAVIYTFCYF